ncbi:MAG: DUF721 domain-containing protein [Bacteroidales bacterium]|nr:DUF721 domain-containing protein [Bacteroidales bacterium]
MRVERKTAEGMDNLMLRYVKAMGISFSHNCRRIYQAWDEASGAADHTIRRYFKDGTLSITLDSSVLRSVLFLQTDLLIAKINQILDEDELFIKDDPRLRKVEKLILK